MATQNPIERNGNIIYIARQAGLTAKEKLSALEKIASEEIDAFNAVNLSTMAYNVGVIWKQVRNRQERESIRTIVDKLLDRVTANAPRKISQFDSQALANTVWSFATVGRADERLFDAVASEAPRKIAQFNPQNPRDPE